MKVAVSSVLAGLLLEVVSFGAVPDASMSLRGIIYIPGPKAKLALVTQADREFLLPEGQRDGDFEMVRIVPEKGKVTVRDNKSGESRELSFAKATEQPAGVGVIQLESAPVLGVAWFYQEMLGQTILFSPRAIEGSLTFTTTNCYSRAEGVSAMETVFRAAGLSLSARGPKFQIMVSDREGVLERSISDPPEEPGGTAKAELIPPGLIAFLKINYLQVLEIYESLTGRTVIFCPENLSPERISLKTRTWIARQEAIWMLASALRLAGVSIVPEGKEFAFALRPGVTNGIPHFAREAAKEKAKTTNGLPRLSWRTGETRGPFLSPQGPIRKYSGSGRRYQFDGTELLQMYGQLIGREPVSLPPDFSNLWLYLNGDRLDAPQSIYALEALAWANGLAFEMIGTNNVGLSFLPAEKR